MFNAVEFKRRSSSLVILAFDIIYFVGTMKKVKFRTKYQYTGRRKNANLSRRTAKRDLTTAGERQEEIGQ